MLLQGSLEKYVQTFHSNSICLISIYFFCENLSCDSSSVAFYSLYPLLFCFLKYVCFNVLLSILLFQDNFDDDFLLSLLTILIHCSIDCFSLNIGFPFHFPKWYISIGMNWKLIGMPNIY